MHKAHRDDLLKQWNHALCARQSTLTQNASLQMQNNEKYKIARELIETMKAELAERRAVSPPWFLELTVDKRISVLMGH